ncbi:MAG: hypothetical protein VX424_17195 [Actinomycetota bacterium]|nr:hypothetical protein [Actinomycetota bacterium]
MSQFGQRRVCLHNPSLRANTMSGRRNVRHEIAPTAGVDPLCGGPRPAAATDDDEDA